MSTCYFFKGDGVKFDDILKIEGLEEAVSENTTPTSRCITDGSNFLWFSLHDDGVTTSADRYGGNDVTFILGEITNVLGAEVFSEHDPEFHQMWEEDPEFQKVLAEEGEDE